MLSLQQRCQALVHTALDEKMAQITEGMMKATHS